MRVCTEGGETSTAALGRLKGGLWILGVTRRTPERPQKSGAVLGVDAGARRLRVGLVAQRYMSLMLTIFADDPDIV